MRKKSKVLNIIMVLAGILCIADFVFLTAIGAVVNVGTLFPLIIGAVLITYSILRFYNKSLFSSIHKPEVLKGIKLLFVLFIASFIVIESMIIFSLKSDKTTDIDYVIILGAGLKGDKMTLTFQNRVDKAIEYLRENPSLIHNSNFKVIVTGGQGPGETITEADAMKRYLVEKGVPEDIIIKEDKSTSTMENFKFSKRLMKIQGNKSKIMIFTSDFHMFRAKMLARRNGFDAYGITSQTWWGILPNSIAREYLAVIKSFMLDV